MKTNFILAFLVFYPIVGAMISYIIGRFRKTARDYFADFIVVSEFAVVLYLFGSFCADRFSVPRCLPVNTCGIFP